MKKIVLLASLVGTMLTGCSNDSLVGSEGNGSDPIDVTRNFLSVTVVPTNGIGTRAEYDDGSDVESNVRTVRFFFFDAEGAPTPVWENRGTGSYSSYLDWYPNSSDIDEGDKETTVEKVLHTTLGLVIPSGYDNPASVLAVINPTSTILDELFSQTNRTVGTGDETKPLLGPSLEQLLDNTDDYLTGLTGYKNVAGEDVVGNFVMSNSVYVKDTKTVDVTILEEGAFADTPENATPVVIYVERVLARLDFGISSEMNGTKVEDGMIYATGSSYTSEADDTQDIYVKFLGWNVTGTADKSRLVKSINPSWTDNEVFGNNVPSEPWNVDNYHRSFWALNPKDISYQYGDYNAKNTSRENVNPANLPISQAGKYSSTYLQENANYFNDDKKAGAPEYATKVIIAAQLCNENGEPFELAEWGYHKYTVDGLKTELANTPLSQLYKKQKGADVTTYTKIEPEDLDFKTAIELGWETDDPDYAVYVVLGKDAEKYEWALMTSPNEFVSYTTSKVNAYIRDKVIYVRIWKEGMTYYFFDVKHLGAEGSAGYHGIVRNHIYRTTVKKVEGLGTPVYQPDQIIIPEENEYEESIVTADVKILQWRIVNSEYELKWPQ